MPDVKGYAGIIIRLDDTRKPEVPEAIILFPYGYLWTFQSHTQPAANDGTFQDV